MGGLGEVRSQEYLRGAWVENESGALPLRFARSAGYPGLVAPGQVGIHPRMPRADGPGPGLTPWWW